jgi:hypothetical protein
MNLRIIVHKFEILVCFVNFLNPQAVYSLKHYNEQIQIMLITTKKLLPIFLKFVIFSLNKTKACFLCR